MQIQKNNELTVNISGQDVKFKANYLTPMIYKRHFKKDFLVELVKALDEVPNNTEAISSEKSMSMMRNVESDFYYELAWALARTANPKIPKLKKWLDSLPDLSIVNLTSKTIDLVMPLVEGPKRR